VGENMPSNRDVRRATVEVKILRMKREAL